MESGSTVSENCQIMYLGPYSAGRLLLNGGSATRLQLDTLNFFRTIFRTTSKLKVSLFYEKNCQLMYLGPHNVGYFEQMGVSADRPKMDQFGIFSTLQNSKRVFFMEKWTSHVLRALYGGHFG